MSRSLLYQSKQQPIQKRLHWAPRDRFKPDFFTFFASSIELNAHEKKVKMEDLIIVPVTQSINNQSMI